MQRDCCDFFELTALDQAIDRGTRRLLELQRPDGIWVGELESNVTMTAQHLFWNHALGLRTPELDRGIANELIARMRADGTWSIWFEGPADLSTSIEAYVALRMCGVDPGPEALAYIQREGGIPKAACFTKCFLALLGQWPWQRMVPIPPELVLLPAVGAVLDLQLRVLGPADVRRALGRPVAAPGASRRRRPVGDRRDRRDALAHRARPNALRRRALRVAEQWIRERQEADGSWGGIQPPWVWGIIALAALGHGFEDDTLRRAVEGWEGFMVRDGDRLRPEACQSPVWDTGLAVLGLRACGVPADHPQLRAAGAYLLGQEVTIKGDWAIRAPGLAPGGWAFEYENDLYPDTDDAAVISLALRQLNLGDDAVARGLDWLVGMQSRGGGWGAFDVDNQAMWLYKIPFCDFGKVTDEPSADVTAHALETLGHERWSRRRDRAWPRVAARRAGGGRLVVRALGRQPPLRDGRRSAGARGVRCAFRPSRRAPRRRLARLGAAGARRLRRGHPLVQRRGLARSRILLDSLTNRVGTARLRGRRKR